MIPSFLEEVSLWKKRNKMPRGHTACLCKNSTQFLETVFRVWNTKYLNNLVYLLIFQKLSNFSQLATLSPFVASVLILKKKMRKITCYIVIHVSLAFTCSKRMAFNISSFFTRQWSTQFIQIKIYFKSNCKLEALAWICVKWIHTMTLEH